MSDPDLLLHGHLEGSLAEDEARDLEERLREDAGLRRRLAEMAFDQAQMREILEVESASRKVPIAPPRRVVPRPPYAAAAIILAAVGLAVAWRWTRPEPTMPAPATPQVRKDPVPSDIVRGRVARKVDGGFTLAVTGAPGMPRLVGRTVRVEAYPPGRREGEEPSVEELFVRKLAAREEVEVRLREDKEDRWLLGPLTPEQIEWARRREERERRPDQRREDR